MTMTRQNYVTIAEAIVVTRAKYTGTYADPNDVLDTLASLLADDFGDDNPRFDAERFLAATKEEIPS